MSTPYNQGRDSCDSEYPNPPTHISSLLEGRLPDLCCAMKRTSVFATPIVLASLLVYSALSSNTDCISHRLDWYTEYVGETPCE